VVIFYFVKRKKDIDNPGTVKIGSPPARFDDVVAGQQTSRNVEVTNLMGVPVTVKSVLIDHNSNGISVGDSIRTPLMLAPGEKLGIPVTISGDRRRGQAALRITVATARTRKDEVRTVKVSYGGGKSRIGKLIP
jgi:hypothetical protein